MTSSEMKTKTRILVGDPDSEKFTSDSTVYNALSVSQRSFVNLVLGATWFKDNYEVFTELMKNQTISVGTSGFHLSGLDNDMARNGYVNSKTVLDGKERYITRLPLSKIGLLNNQYFRGCNMSPTCYLLNNVYYVQVDTGSYPLDVTLYYIAVPTDIDLSTEPVVNSTFHDLICIMAEEVLRGALDDFEKANYLRDKIITPLINSVAGAQLSEPQSRTIGQYMRKVKG